MSQVQQNSSRRSFASFNGYRMLLRDARSNSTYASRDKRAWPVVTKSCLQRNKRKRRCRRRRGRRLAVYRKRAALQQGQAHTSPMRFARGACRFGTGDQYRDVQGAPPADFNNRFLRTTVRRTFLGENVTEHDSPAFLSKP